MTGDFPFGFDNYVLNINHMSSSSSFSMDSTNCLQLHPGMAHLPNLRKDEFFDSS